FSTLIRKSQHALRPMWIGPVETEHGYVPAHGLFPRVKRGVVGLILSLAMQWGHHHRKLPVHVIEHAVLRTERNGQVRAAERDARNHLPRVGHGANQTDIPAAESV